MKFRNPALKYLSHGLRIPKPKGEEDMEATSANDATTDLESSVDTLGSPLSEWTFVLHLALVEHIGDRAMAILDSDYYFKTGSVLFS